jgi:hypothetical protein
MNYYTYIDNKTEMTIEMSVPSIYEMKCGDKVILNGIKYKIVGVGFTLGDNNSNKFFVEKINGRVE